MTWQLESKNSFPERENNMQIILMGYGQGKTHMLCDWLTQKPDTRIVIVSTLAHVDMVRERVPVSVAQNIMTYNEFLRENWKDRISNPEIAIDDIDDVLLQILSLRPSLVTTTA